MVLFSSFLLGVSSCNKVDFWKCRNLIFLDLAVSSSAGDTLQKTPFFKRKTFLLEELGDRKDF